METTMKNTKDAKTKTIGDDLVITPKNSPGVLAQGILITRSGKKHATHDGGI